MSKETETKVVEMATEAAPKTIEQLKVRESELDQINDDLIKEMQTREYEIDFKTKIIEAQIDGMLLKINEHEFWTRLIGNFNAYNITAVYAIAILLGQDQLQVLTTLSTMHSVRGRFEYLKAKNGTLGIVDYAHTPDALQNVLETIADVNSAKVQVITVVGCGGDRDRTKRPEMARIAADMSNRVLLTSDNPRSEDPAMIRAAVLQGCPEAVDAGAREDAIAKAMDALGPGDVLAVAGKGHESGQEIAGIVHAFDDVAMVRKLVGALP